MVLVDLDELVEHWTVLEDERELVAGKRGPTRLGFALMLKFYTRSGRFPRGRAELRERWSSSSPARSACPRPTSAFYEWSGRTIEYHRAQIRRHLGFRECSRRGRGKLTEWLAASVARPSGGPTGYGRNCWRSAAPGGSSRRRRAAATGSSARPCTRPSRR